MTDVVSTSYISGPYMVPRVGRAEITSVSSLAGRLVVDAPYFIDRHAALGIVAPMYPTVSSRCVIDGDMPGGSTVRARCEIHAPMVNAFTDNVTFKPVAVIRGINVLLDGLSISGDESQYAWTCDMSLADMGDYRLFGINEAFSIDLAGEVYNFIVDGKSLSRTGVSERTASIKGISPAANFAEPRHKPVTFAIDGYSAFEAPALMAGASVSWEILNWYIKEGRLQSTNQAPLRIVQQIAGAAGGVVVSEPNGSIRVRYDFPRAVPTYNTGAADLYYNDIEDNFTITEHGALPEDVNSIRVMDVAPDSVTNQDSIEFVQDQSSITRGELRIVPKPWRTSLRVTHSSNSRVSVIFDRIVTETITETVEVIAGKCSTSRPINNLLSFTPLFTDLGSPFYIQNEPGLVFNDNPTESLYRIEYETRYLRYRVSAFKDAKVQFLSYEFGTSDAYVGADPDVIPVDVIVQRSGGDRPGDTIVDGLIGDTNVALQRGRNELDARASGLQDVDVETRYRTGVRTGMVAEFADLLTGEIWRGKVSGITHNAGRAGDGHFELTTQLALKRPTNFYG